MAKRRAHRKSRAKTQERVGATEGHKDSLNAQVDGRLDGQLGDQVNGRGNSHDGDHATDQIQAESFGKSKINNMGENNARREGKVQMTENQAQKTTQASLNLSLKQSSRKKPLITYTSKTPGPKNPNLKPSAATSSLPSSNSKSANFKTYSSRTDKTINSGMSDAEGYGLTKEDNLSIQQEIEHDQQKHTDARKSARNEARTLLLTEALAALKLADDEEGADVEADDGIIETVIRDPFRSFRETTKSSEKGKENKGGEGKGGSKLAESSLPRAVKPVGTKDPRAAITHLKKTIDALGVQMVDEHRSQPQSQLSFPSRPLSSLTLSEENRSLLPLLRAFPSSESQPEARQSAGSSSRTSESPFQAQKSTFASPGSDTHPDTLPGPPHSAESILSSDSLFPFPQPISTNVNGRSLESISKSNTAHTGSIHMPTSVPNTAKPSKPLTGTKSAKKPALKDMGMTDLVRLLREIGIVEKYAYPGARRKLTTKEMVDSSHPINSAPRSGPREYVWNTSDESSFDVNTDRNADTKNPYQTTDRQSLTSLESSPTQMPRSAIPRCIMEHFKLVEPSPSLAAHQCTAQCLASLKNASADATSSSEDANASTEDHPEASIEDLLNENMSGNSSTRIVAILMVAALSGRDYHPTIRAIKEATHNTHDSVEAIGHLVEKLCNAFVGSLHQPETQVDLVREYMHELVRFTQNQRGLPAGNPNHRTLASTSSHGHALMVNHVPGIKKRQAHRHNSHVPSSTGQIRVNQDLVPLHIRQRACQILMVDPIIRYTQVPHFITHCHTRSHGHAQGPLVCSGVPDGHQGPVFPHVPPTYVTPWQEINQVSPLKKVSVSSPSVPPPQCAECALGYPHSIASSQADTGTSSGLDHATPGTGSRALGNNPVRQPTPEQMVQANEKYRQEQAAQGYPDGCKFELYPNHLIQLAIEQREVNRQAALALAHVDPLQVLFPRIPSPDFASDIPSHTLTTPQGKATSSTDPTMQCHQPIQPAMNHGPSSGEPLPLLKRLPTEDLERMYEDTLKRLGQLQEALDRICASHKARATENAETRSTDNTKTRSTESTESIKTCPKETKESSSRETSDYIPSEWEEKSLMDGSIRVGDSFPAGEDIRVGESIRVGKISRSVASVVLPSRSIQPHMGEISTISASGTTTFTTDSSLPRPVEEAESSTRFL